MAHRVESLNIIGAMQKNRERGLLTRCITCNLCSNPAEAAESPIQVVVDLKFAISSSRMKLGES
jgi:N-acetylmuramic acid 6-phosphate etherase